VEDFTKKAGVEAEGVLLTFQESKGAGHLQKYTVAGRRARKEASKSVF
jgi:hypothetical protein